VPTPTPTPVTITPHIRQLALQVARALENPDTWCTGADARSAAGYPAGFNEPTATRWCAYGHALRLGGADAAHELHCIYHVMFHSYLTPDNDRPSRGREYVRDRLLELANS
jgi:hypothetical protein